MRRLLSALLCFLIPALPAAVGALAPVERPDEDLLILEVRLGDAVLSGGLFGYLDSRGVLLPLGELMTLIEFPIRVDPAAGTAQGWFLAENRRFSLDLGRGEAVVDGTAARVDGGLAELHFDDVYVEAELLSRWFPVAFEVDLAALVLHLKPRQQLPVELRLERARRWQQFARTTAAPRSGPRFAPRDEPYRLLAWPVLDLSFDLSLERTADDGTRTSARHAVLAQGDLLGMTADLFVSGTRGSEAGGSPAAGRLVLGRRNLDGSLLGVLGATEYLLGDLASPSEPLISRGRPGRGIQIGRELRPIGAGEFDRTTLRGDALPGWEVELYRNNQLFDFLTVGEDGRYEFAEVPLYFGMNVLRLVFYGPHGQTREKKETIFIGSELLRPGATSWRFGVCQQDLGLVQDPADLDPVQEALRGTLRLHGAFERGLTSTLSLAAGVNSYELPDRRHDYFRLGLRTALFGAAGRLQVIVDAGGGWAGQVNFQRRLGRFTLAAEHLRLFDFVSEELTVPDLASRSEARLEGQLRAPGVGSIPFGLTLRHERLGDGDQFRLRGTSGFTLSRRRFQLGNRVRFDLAGDGTLTANGTILVNARGRRLRLRGNLAYGLWPEPEVSSLNLTGDWQVTPRLGTTFGLSHQLDQGVTTVTGGGDWRLHALRLGVNLGAGTDGSLRLAASVFFSVGCDPRSGRPRLRADAAAKQGAVSARAFLDHNADGRFDAADEPLADVGFVVNGSPHEARTDAGGIAHLLLSPGRHADLSLDESTLADPYWVPQVTGRGFLPRPGVSWTAEFPVALTGEIDGTVYLRDDEGRREVANVQLQLLDARGEVVQEVKSQFDGFYLFEKLLPGRYSLRLAPDQARRLGLTAPVREIAVRSGEVVSGSDLVVERSADRPA